MSESDHIANALQSDIREALQREVGFNADLAETLAGAVFRNLQARWGAREIYIPVADNISERNKTIRLEFTGINHAEICRRHNISMSTLYRIIR